jgi:hypothetical protein
MSVKTAAFDRLLRTAKAVVDYRLDHVPYLAWVSSDGEPQHAADLVEDICALRAALVVFVAAFQGLTCRECGGDGTLGSAITTALAAAAAEGARKEREASISDARNTACNATYLSNGSDFTKGYRAGAEAVAARIRSRSTTPTAGSVPPGSRRSRILPADQVPIRPRPNPQRCGMSSAGQHTLDLLKAAQSDVNCIRSDLVENVAYDVESALDHVLAALRHLEERVAALEDKR